MKNSINIYECTKCGSQVEEIIECKCDECCGISCCGEIMKKIDMPSEGNSDTHIPKYERVEDEILVSVGNTAHPMNKDHYILWVELVTDNVSQRVMLYPEQDIEVRFKYKPGATIYAYCNKHGLWKKDVK